MNDFRRRMLILTLGLGLGSAAGYAALHGPAAALSRVGAALPTL